MLDFTHAFSRVDYRQELTDATEDQKRAFLKGLEAVCSESTPALNELRDWLRSTLEEIEPPTRSDREVVERRKVQGLTYQLEKIRCGKPGCKCAKGALHGGYWYAYFRTNGKLKSKYIGKRLPTEAIADDQSSSAAASAAPSRVTA